MKDLRKDLPEMIRRRASLFREMAITATDSRDRHDYRMTADRLERQARDIETTGKTQGAR